VRRGPALLVLAALVAPAARAQEVVVHEVRTGPAAAIIRGVVAGPHAVLGGEGRLDLPRDSTITTSLLVLGRPTYLASRVRGDVVVVGADLYLRPGADVSGRAVAIGGTVSRTTLGRVAGGVESMRDESYVVRREGSGYALDSREARVEERASFFQLPGIQGVLMPSYDRVDGLSLPVGVRFVMGEDLLEVEPTVTYRSRLGAFDPGVAVRVAPERTVSFDGRVARDTRTNDAWIYSNLVNSATTFFVGTDTRNYFRSELAEGRLSARVERAAFTLAPYLGVRSERVREITAAGNVFSVLERDDSLKTRRPNPLVERGNIGSALVGGELASTTGIVATRVRADVEQSFRTPAGRSGFTQLTLNAGVELPTFRTQTLSVKVHGVATRGDAIPAARFAYLGGSGTLATLDLLEQGGSALLFVENRYRIPIDAIQLPFAGTPIVSVRDAFGAAGVGSLPALQHEIGAGLGLSVLNFDVNVGVAGRKRTKFGMGISLSL
jgi:hypothetical protein